MQSINLQKGLSVLDDKIHDAPQTSGVYKMLDEHKNIIYIGKAKNISKRLSQYKNIDKMPNRLRLMVSLIRDINILITNTESDALILEANLIKSVNPRFNIALRDDKSFPYISIDMKHQFPRITKHRGKKEINTHYYGPFSSVDNLEATIKELQKIFMIRSCSNNFFELRKKQNRACLLYQIKRCSGPCVNKIAKHDYTKSITQAVQFLSGKSKDLQIEMIKQMEEASNNLEFEKAANIRDRIQLLTQMQEKRVMLDYHRDIDIHIFATYRKDSDACIHVFFMRSGVNYQNQQYFLQDVSDDDYHNAINIFILQFYNHANIPTEIWANIPHDEILVLHNALSSIENTKSPQNNTKQIHIINPLNNSIEGQIMEFALDNAKNSLLQYRKNYLKKIDTLIRLQKIFELSEIPERIEIYDNSHIFGQYAFGCMVVADTQGLNKSEYRKFRIKNSYTSDDYLMLKEVLSRRFKNISETKLPNLIIIDGGAGHLSVACDILNQIGLCNKISIICIAKGRKRNAGEEWFFMPGKAKFQLPKNDPVLFYMQNLRDEVHKFAITSHKKARAKSMTNSAISTIPGIGQKRKQVLLSIFGSYERICTATLEELASIKSIGPKGAKKIYSYLQNHKKSSS